MIPAVIINLRYSSKYIRAIVSLLALLLIPLCYHITPSVTVSDVPKEANFFITADAASHKNIKSAYIERYYDYPGYYKYYGIPKYGEEISSVDVVYINPFRFVETQMYSHLDQYNLDKENILKIRINDSKIIFKKYLYNTYD
jgi:hypothetical protein